MMGMGSGNADVADYGKSEEKQAPAEEKSSESSEISLLKQVLEVMREVRQEVKELRGRMDTFIKDGNNG